MEVKPVSQHSKLWNIRFPNFKPSEVLSDDGMYAFLNNIITINFEALDALQEFRNKINKTILVNHGSHKRRGYRSYVENAAVDGKEFSYHMQGIAFDITSPDISIDELAELVKDFGWLGIGIYKKRNFIHCDLRPRLYGDRVIWEE